MEVLLASGNPKKLIELRALLEPHGVQLLEPSDVGGLPEVIEDQPTFEGNAEKKAVSAARHSKRWCLADDSGLEVDFLDGAPGVISARFAGDGPRSESQDAANNAKLLTLLEGVPDAQRGAHFVCVLCLARPDGQVALSLRGETRGRILHTPRGTRDFGYDPLFEFTEPGFPQTGKGFAELEAAQKSAISHRGRALQALLLELPNISLS